MKAKKMPTEYRLQIIRKGKKLFVGEFSHKLVRVKKQILGEWVWRIEQQELKARERKNLAYELLTSLEWDRSA